MGVRAHPAHVAVTAPFDRVALASVEARATVRWGTPLEDAVPILTGPHRGIASGAHALVVELDVVDRAALDALPDLELVVVCRGTPVNVDLEACAERGIAVRATPGRNAEAVADVTMALLLDAVRQLGRSERWLRAGQWTPERQYDPYLRFRGPTLAGRTLGIVGFGAVGRQVARRALGFGLRVLATGPRLRAADVPDGVEAVGMGELLRRSHVVSLHATAGPQTRGLIGAAELAAMQPGAVLLNTARASLVEEGALVEALASGHLGGVALDVFWSEPLPADHPLTRLPGAVLTPHIAGASDDVVRNHSRAAAEHLETWLDARPPADAG